MYLINALLHRFGIPPRPWLVAIALLLGAPLLVFGQAERLESDAQSGRLSGRMATGLLVPPIQVSAGETGGENAEMEAARRRSRLGEQQKMRDQNRRRRYYSRKKKDVASGNR